MIIVNKHDKPLVCLSRRFHTSEIDDEGICLWSSRVQGSHKLRAVQGRSFREKRADLSNVFFISHPAKPRDLPRALDDNSPTPEKNKLVNVSPSVLSPSRSPPRVLSSRSHAKPIETLAFTRPILRFLHSAAGFCLLPFVARNELERFFEIKWHTFLFIFIYFSDYVSPRCLPCIRVYNRTNYIVLTSSLLMHILYDFFSYVTSSMLMSLKGLLFVWFLQKRIVSTRCIRVASPLKCAFFFCYHRGNDTRLK